MKRIINKGNGIDESYMDNEIIINYKLIKNGEIIRNKKFKFKIN